MAMIAEKGDVEVAEDDIGGSFVVGVAVPVESIKDKRLVVDDREGAFWLDCIFPPSINLVHVSWPSGMRSSEVRGRDRSMSLGPTSDTRMVAHSSPGQS